MIIKVFNKKGEKESSNSFREKQVILGRNPKVHNSVLIDSESVSRSHLKFILKNNKIKVFDLDSSNGTFINGQQIPKDQKVTLGTNDKLTLGDFSGYVTAEMRDSDKKKDSSASSQESDEEERERSRQKPKKSSQVQIAQSTLKMLRSMTADKKSKPEKIKFLKLMGCHNPEQNWDEIEQMIKSKKTYFLSNSNKKASEDLEKQFALSRSAHEKRGLGK